MKNKKIIIFYHQEALVVIKKHDKNKKNDINIQIKKLFSMINFLADKRLPRKKPPV